jgi:hypothetical protein
VTVIALVALVYLCKCERFASKREKSRAIVEWFNKSPGGFSEFREQVTPDVVAYEDARRLNHQGRLSASSLEKLL